MAKHKKVEGRLIFGKSPMGYPKFVFRYDDTVNKYSIMNTETKEKTQAFIDEVYLSSKPLKTWTSDYVVVRIDEKYFLCDNNGNCFFESNRPYIICRNVFVSEDGNYIITKKLEKISVIGPDESFFIIEFEGSKYALYKSKTAPHSLKNGWVWVNCYGKLRFVRNNHIKTVMKICE